jgi:hypothetical protein
MIRWRYAVAAIALLCAGATPPTPPRLAQLGIEFSGIQRLKDYDARSLADVRDNLHVSYLRTGWIPGWLKYDKTPWQREDRAMHRLCGAGLKAMIITPSPKDDRKGVDHLVQNIGDFFARYTRREPGCIAYAEIGNENDLPQNSFAGVQEYARFYMRVAPLAAKDGITVITTGTSGKDLPWTYALASMLRTAPANVPVGNFGFHPYGVEPSQMASAVAEMRAAAASGLGRPCEIYVTEIGEKDPQRLYDAIVTLAHATPAITVFEYERQPAEEVGFSLKDNPALYDAMQRAWKRLANP